MGVLHSYYRLKKPPKANDQTALNRDHYLCLGPAKANKWSNLKALSTAELLPLDAALTGLLYNPFHSTNHPFATQNPNLTRPKKKNLFKIIPSQLSRAPSFH